MRVLFTLVFAFGSALASPAVAQEAASPLPVHTALEQVRADAGCEFSTWPLYDLYFCRDALTVWYFARPEHEGYPGYVQRRMERRDGSVYMVTTGYSDAGDEQQAAFQAWMEQVGQSLLR